MKTKLLLALSALSLPFAVSAISGSGTKEAAAAPEPTKAAETSTASPLDLIPAELVNAKGEKVSKDALKGKIVGIYYSAHWCPPCRAFTPELVKFRDANAAEFEVVFVSFDKDAAAMKGYMEETKMQWTAVPYGNAAKDTLAKRFEVNGIPALIIIGADGKVITKNGRGDVTSLKNEALAAWKKKA